MLQKFVDDLLGHLKQRLMVPAVPVFLRLCSNVHRTGEFRAFWYLLEWCTAL